MPAENFSRQLHASLHPWSCYHSRGELDHNHHHVAATRAHYRSVKVSRSRSRSHDRSLANNTQPLNCPHRLLPPSPHRPRRSRSPPPRASPRLALVNSVRCICPAEFTARLHHSADLDRRISDFVDRAVITVTKGFPSALNISLRPLKITGITLRIGKSKDQLSTRS